ncbi:MAG: DUF1127 domain-containing protein [Pseudomonadota bacterium]
MGFSQRLKQAARNYAEYRRIVGEIESMSLREADDIGINRADAARIAHRAVYGS